MFLWYLIYNAMLMIMREQWAPHPPAQTKGTPSTTSTVIISHNFIPKEKEKRKKILHV